MSPTVITLDSQSVAAFAGDTFTYVEAWKRADDRGHIILHAPALAAAVEVSLMTDTNLAIFPVTYYEAQGFALHGSSSRQAHAGVRFSLFDKDRHLVDIVARRARTMAVEHAKREAEIAAGHLND